MLEVKDNRFGSFWRLLRNPEELAHYLGWQKKTAETTRRYEVARLGDRMVDAVARSPACLKPCIAALDGMGNGPYTAESLLPLLNRLILLAQDDSALRPDDRNAVANDLRVIREDLCRRLPTPTRS